MKTQVEKMLQKGVIRESNSPWSAPALLVPKRSTDGKPKLRFCVDFRALNSVTKFDTNPLPIFDEATSNLHGSKYYSVLDCYSGFWQINTKRRPASLSHPNTMSSTGYPLDYQIAHRVFNVAWILF